VEDLMEQLDVIVLRGKSGNIYNVGMNSERSIEQLVRDIGSILGINIQICSGSENPGSTTRRCPSINKLHDIGYKKRDNYYKGLEKTIVWYKEYFVNQAIKTDKPSKEQAKFI
jgi:dTDP-D-glucose 4,6-dehydratase